MNTLRTWCRPCRPRAYCLSLCEFIWSCSGRVDLEALVLLVPSISSGSYSFLPLLQGFPKPCGDLIKMSHLGLNGWTLNHLSLLYQNSIHLIFIAFKKAFIFAAVIFQLAYCVSWMALSMTATFHCRWLRCSVLLDPFQWKISEKTSMFSPHFDDFPSWRQTSHLRPIPNCDPQSKTYQDEVWMSDSYTQTQDTLKGPLSPRDLCQWVLLSFSFSKCTSAYTVLPKVTLQRAIVCWMACQNVLSRTSSSCNGVTSVYLGDSMVDFWSVRLIPLLILGNF